MVCRDKEEAQRASTAALEEMAHLMFVSSRANGDLALASKLNQDVADVAIGGWSWLLRPPSPVHTALVCTHPVSTRTRPCGGPSAL